MASKPLLKRAKSSENLQKQVYSPVPVFQVDVHVHIHKKIIYRLYIYVCVYICRYTYVCMHDSLV